MKMVADSWEDIIARLRKVEVHRDLTVRKTELPSHPSTFKARPGIPLNATHYSKPLKGGGGIHLKEFSDRYMVHRDHADANEEPIQHLLKDTSTSDKVLFVGVAGVIDHLVLDGRLRKWAGRKINEILSQLFPEK